MRSFLVIAISACASSPPVTAAKPAKPATPASDAEVEQKMSALKFYAGHWHCETTDYEAPGKGKKPGAPANVYVRRALGGSWYEVEMDIMPSPEMQAGWHTHEFKGFDPATRKWMMVGMMSKPGGWVTLGSDGFADNRMIWTPTAPETPPTRGVMTRISDTEYDHAEEQDDGKGFLPTWSKHCQKVDDV